MGFGAVAPRAARDRRMRERGKRAAAGTCTGAFRTFQLDSVLSYLGSRITTARVLCVVCQIRVRTENRHHCAQNVVRVPPLLGAVLTSIMIELQAS